MKKIHDEYNADSRLVPEEQENEWPDSRAAEEPSGEDVPSSEAEIELGVNQDVSSGESFFSEPSPDAAGEEDSG